MRGYSGHREAVAQFQYVFDGATLQDLCSVLFHVECWVEGFSYGSTQIVGKCCAVVADGVDACIDEWGYCH